MNSDILSYQSSFKNEEIEELKYELNNLKEKNIKNKEKNFKLKSENEELKLKIKILEEENKILSVTRQPIYQKPQIIEPSIPTSKISNLLTDFDILLENQSNEISKLTKEKEILSKLCFKSLDLVEEQDKLIQKFKRSIKKLISYICQNGENLNSIQQEFKDIDIDIIKEIPKLENFLNFSIFIDQFKLNSNLKININEIENLLNEIPKIGLNNNSLIIIFNYLKNYIENEKNLNQKINELEIENNEINKSLELIFNNLNKKFKININEAIEIILILKNNFKENKFKEKILNKLIFTIINFIEKTFQDPDIQKCLNRINLWKETYSNDIDIIQEIDFLMGLCFIGRNKIKKNNEIFNKELNNEKEMLQQILDLKDIVKDMRERLHLADNERMKFIKNKLKNKLPLNSQWTEICDYLLKIT